MILAFCSIMGDEGLGDRVNIFYRCYAIKSDDGTTTGSFGVKAYGTPGFLHDTVYALFQADPGKISFDMDNLLLQKAADKYHYDNFDSNNETELKALEGVFETVQRIWTEAGNGLILPMYQTLTKKATRSNRYSTHHDFIPNFNDQDTDIWLSNIPGKKNNIFHFFPSEYGLTKRKKKQLERGYGLRMHRERRSRGKTLSE